MHGHDNHEAKDKTTEYQMGETSLNQEHLGAKKSKTTSKLASERTPHHQERASNTASTHNML